VGLNRVHLRITVVKSRVRTRLSSGRPERLVAEIVILDLMAPGKLPGYATLRKRRPDISTPGVEMATGSCAPSVIISVLSTKERTVGFMATCGIVSERVAEVFPGVGELMEFALLMALPTAQEINLSLWAISSIVCDLAFKRSKFTSTPTPSAKIAPVRVAYITNSIRVNPFWLEKNFCLS